MTMAVENKNDVQFRFSRLGLNDQIESDASKCSVQQQHANDWHNHLLAGCDESGRKWLDIDGVDSIHSICAGAHPPSSTCLSSLPSVSDMNKWGQMCTHDNSEEMKSALHRILQCAAIVYEKNPMVVYHLRRFLMILYKQGTKSHKSMFEWVIVQPLVCLVWLSDLFYDEHLDVFSDSAPLDIDVLCSSLRQKQNNPHHLHDGKIEPVLHLLGSPYENHLNQAERHGTRLMGNQFIHDLQTCISKGTFPDTIKCMLRIVSTMDYGDRHHDTEAYAKFFADIYQPEQQCVRVFDLLVGMDLTLLRTVEDQFNELIMSNDRSHACSSRNFWTMLLLLVCHNSLCQHLQRGVPLAHVPTVNESTLETRLIASLRNALSTNDPTDTKPVGHNNTEREAYACLFAMSQPHAKKNVRFENLWALVIKTTVTQVSDVYNAIMNDTTEDRSNFISAMEPAQWAKTENRIFVTSDCLPSSCKANDRTLLTQSSLCENVGTICAELKSKLKPNQRYTLRVVVLDPEVNVSDWPAHTLDNIDYWDLDSVSHVPILYLCKRAFNRKVVTLTPLNIHRVTLRLLVTAYVG
jgi:hypothetical protein